MGMNGKNSDGINLSPSPFKIDLENNSLNLPELHVLPDRKMRVRNKNILFVCDGDLHVLFVRHLSI